MNILVIGGAGYVGSQLCASWKGKHRVLTTGCTHHGADFPLDLTDNDVDQQVDDLLDMENFDAVVFAAGVTDRRWCQEHPVSARTVNGESVAQVASACMGRKFVYISDAYVFDGHAKADDKGRFTEKDDPAPKTVYAKSKRLGEIMSLRNRPDSLIVRTSGIYGPACPLFEWLRTVSTPGQKIPLWQDRLFSPTYVGDLARAIECLCLRDAHGIYHVAGVQQNRAQWLLRVAVNLGLVTTDLECHVAPDDCMMPKNLSLWCEKLKSNEMPHSHTANLALCVKGVAK